MEPSYDLTGLKCGLEKGHDHEMLRFRRHLKAPKFGFFLELFSTTLSGNHVDVFLMEKGCK